MSRTHEVLNQPPPLAVYDLAHPRLDEAMSRVFAELDDPADAEQQARRLVEGLALLTAAALLARHARSEVFAAFAASRLAGEGGHLYGTLPPGLDLAAIIEPAIPA